MFVLPDFKGLMEVVEVKCECFLVWPCFQNFYVLQKSKKMLHGVIRFALE